MSELPQIFLHDSMTGKKLPFQPKIPGSVSIYCCGPTVYGFTHIGNARAALSLDLVTRIFQLAGYQVVSARNYTDIDDKIIDVAKREKKPTTLVAEEFTKAFDHEMKELKALPPTFAPKATETIPEMIDFILGLENKGLAYRTETAHGTDVYFRVESFPAYGRLSKRKLEDMIAGSRIDISEVKESVADFALWKAAKPDEPKWSSPFGDGRPGWHLECSAMIRKSFEDGIDIHMGGLDLLFPHHENEIAQSEGLSGKKLANYWVHNGMIELNKEKMSKSVGNLIRTGDFIESFGAEALRVLIFGQHYRSPMDASEESILRAEALVERLYVCKKMADAAAEITTADTLPIELQNLHLKMRQCLFDDFNSARALGLVLAAARTCFREQRPEYWKALSPGLEVLRNALGLLHESAETALQEGRSRRLKRFGLSEEGARAIDELLKDRERLRAAKAFGEADEVRRTLESRGIIVMDGPDGSSWSVRR